MSGHAYTEGQLVEQAAIGLFWIRHRAENRLSSRGEKMWIPLLILVVLIGLVLTECKVTRSGYESTPAT